MSKLACRPRHGLKNGFTTIELILVVVIVGILAALVITTRAGVQQSERDTERQSDIKELRNGLESYFAQTNQYPTLKDLNNKTWRTANMKSIDAEVYRDPSNKSNASQQLVAKPVKNAYAYTVTSASGAECGTPKVPCTQYSLTATLEGGGTFVKNNLN